MKLEERIEAVASAANEFPWLGDLTTESVRRWVELELGLFLNTDEPAVYGDQHCFVKPLSPLLHIVSGNTPHAALQSLIRGIMVGAKNQIKLPERGLSEVAHFVGKLPGTLKPEVNTLLDPSWIRGAEAVVVFGSDETVQNFSRQILPPQRLLAHGSKISLGLVWGRFDQGVIDGAARDVFVFDQLGCLSPQAYYVAGDSREFAGKLAIRLDELRRESATGTVREPEVAAALRTCREEWKFRAATEPGVFVWESAGTLDWVVIHDPGPFLGANPLYRTIFIKPMPADLTSVLAPMRRGLGTLGVHPVNLESARLASRIGAQRVCPIGQMQNPPLTWHHDGWPTLASLVHFVDIEGLGKENG